MNILKELIIFLRSLKVKVTKSKTGSCFQDIGEKQNAMNVMEAG